MGLELIAVLIAGASLVWMVAAHHYPSLKFRLPKFGNNESTIKPLVVLHVDDDIDFIFGILDLLAVTIEEKYKIDVRKSINKDDLNTNTKIFDLYFSIKRRERIITYIFTSEFDVAKNFINNNNVKACILDILMVKHDGISRAEMSGWDMLEELKPLAPTVPFAFLTSYPGASEILDLSEGRSEPYFEKGSYEIIEWLIAKIMK